MSITERFRFPSFTFHNHPLFKIRKLKKPTKKTSNVWVVYEITLVLLWWTRLYDTNGLVNKEFCIAGWIVVCYHIRCSPRAISKPVFCGPHVWLVWSYVEQGNLPSRITVVRCQQIDVRVLSYQMFPSCSKTKFTRPHVIGGNNLVNKWFAMAVWSVNCAQEIDARVLSYEIFSSCYLEVFWEPYVWQV